MGLLQGTLKQNEQSEYIVYQFLIMKNSTHLSFHAFTIMQVFSTHYFHSLTPFLISQHINIVNEVMKICTISLNINIR